MPRQREFNQDDVLYKAMLLFWARGYEATSVRDLTSAMGISSSSLYEAFGDKHAIYMAALERYCRLEQERTVQIAAAAADPADFVARLFASLDTIAISDVRTQGSLAFNAMVEFGARDSAVTIQLLDHYAAVVAIVAGVLEGWQRAGSVTPDVPAGSLAHTLLSTLIGVVTISSVKRDFTQRDVITQLMLKIIQPTA